ncbi:MAG: signal peptidase I [Candidatus Aminicenantes bacterium]|nr:MAG: signal peptidase I [Candidatus Aminicenantes bacterium]
MKKCIRSEEAEFLGLSLDILNKGKSIRFHARGWSMRPFIQDGDFITVSPIEHSSIKIGDVIFYSTAEDKLIAHRVIHKQKQNGHLTIWAKGDALFGPPERIDIKNVLGKVSTIERNGKKERLDTNLFQIKGMLLAGISPLSKWIYPAGSVLKRFGLKPLSIILEILQNLKIYKVLARKIRNVSYHITPSDNAYPPYELYGLEQRQRLKNPTEDSSNPLKNHEDFDCRITASRNNKIIGEVTIAKFPESHFPFEGWWLFGLHVKWHYRGMGIGEKLTRMATEIATENGASEIKLLNFEDAKPARNLYQKLDFRQISIPELDKQLEKEAKTSLRPRIILAKAIKST